MELKTGVEVLEYIRRLRLSYLRLGLPEDDQLLYALIPIELEREVMVELHSLNYLRRDPNDPIVFEGVSFVFSRQMMWVSVTIELTDEIHA